MIDNDEMINDFFENIVLGKSMTISITEEIEISISKENVCVVFWGFENVFFPFNYKSTEEMKRDVRKFLDILLNKEIKIEELSYNNVIYKRTLYYKDGGCKESSWCKIGCSKRIGLYFDKRKKQKRIIFKNS